MIKILKTGNWALEGTRVVEVVEGTEQTFGPVEDCKMVADGWAEWIKTEPVATSDYRIDTRATKAKK